MEAKTVESALRFPDVQRPRYSDADGPFAKFLVDVMFDERLSPFAKIVHAFHKWWRFVYSTNPTFRDVAIRFGKADCTARRAINDLKAAGWLDDRGNAIAPSKAKPQVPRPRVVRPPAFTQTTFRFVDAELTPVVVPDCAETARESSAHFCAPLLIQEREIKTDLPACTREEVRQSVLNSVTEDKPQPAEAPVIIRDYKREAPADEVSEQELADELVQRAAAMFDDARPEHVTKDIRVYGLEAVEFILDKADQRAEMPRHYQWITIALKNSKREGKLPEAVHPRLYMMNYNPPTPTKDLGPEDAPTAEQLTETIANARSVDRRFPALAGFARGILLSWIRQGVIAAADVPADLRKIPNVPKPAQKKPARGTSANFPPSRSEASR
jgi:hypothetical protein